MSQTTNAGIVTAYGAAVRGGYQGSYNDFCTDLANLTQVVNELANLSATAETLVAGSAATATYSNGVFSFGIPRGDKGETGDTGNGIESVSLLSTSGLNKTYRITFTDGTHFDYVVADGKSIVSTVLNVDYTLTITYNDGTTWTSESIRGATGATPNLTIGTVTTGAAGTPASAEITGTAEDPVLNLTIPKGADGDVSPASLASTYSASQTYAVGDYVWYSGQLYCCTTAITTAEAWTAAHWTAAKIANDVKDLKSAISDTTDYALNAYATDTASGAIATLPDGADDIPIKQLSVAIEPVQDLHGYDNPWPVGGGKNLLNWTNTTQTINGVTFTVNSDGSVLVNGTATADASFYSNDLSTHETPMKAGSYIISGCPSNGSNTTYLINEVIFSKSEVGSGVVLTLEEDAVIRLRVVIRSGYTANNLVFKPMIRLATETDPTFAPYSNLCPISGHTECNVTRTGKNLFDKDAVISGRFSTSSSAIISPDNTWDYTYVKVSPNTTYTLSGCNNNDGVGHWWFDEYKNGISKISNHTNGTYTSPSNAYYFGLCSIKMANTSHDIDTIQLELGSTATAYEPYQGTTYPITFPSGTTVYGGNITVNQDGSGSLVVDKGYHEFTGSETFGSDGGGEARVPRWNEPVGGTSYTGFVISNMLRKAISYNGIRNYKNTITINSNRILMNPHGVTYATSADAVNAIKEYCTEQYNSGTPLSVCYELAEPISIPLSASQITTLLGQNSLWADCNGDVSVTYRADTALYIAKKIAEALNA